METELSRLIIPLLHMPAPPFRREALKCQRSYFVLLTFPWQGAMRIKLAHNSSWERTGRHRETHWRPQEQMIQDDPCLPRQGGTSHHSGMWLAREIACTPVICVTISFSAIFFPVQMPLTYGYCHYRQDIRLSV